MKNKSQLIHELDAFILFLQSLSDSSVHHLTGISQTNESIRTTLANVYVQDKLYVHEYLPNMHKDASITSIPKDTLISDIQTLSEQYSTHELISLVIHMRQQLIAFLDILTEGRMHAFFTIDGVMFTMYDHIEHIIYNDGLNQANIQALLESK